jgi:hypothetical protein
MAGEPNRNARCHCGSGKKYKNCHGAEAVASPGGKLPIGYIVAGAVVLALAVMYYTRETTVADRPGAAQPGAAPPGKVWSVEHGH